MVIMNDIEWSVLSYYVINLNISEKSCSKQRTKLQICFRTGWQPYSIQECTTNCSNCNILHLLCMLSNREVSRNKRTHFELDLIIAICYYLTLTRNSYEIQFWNLMVKVHPLTGLFQIYALDYRSKIFVLQ